VGHLDWFEDLLLLLSLVDKSSKVAAHRNLYWRFQLPRASENKQVGLP
jgi:hypothetical protein